MDADPELPRAAHGEELPNAETSAPVAEAPDERTARPIGARPPTSRDDAGRFAPSPASRARIVELREAVAGARGLPDVWRQQLLTELALSLDAADRYLAAVAGGITTRKGRLRRPYVAYLEVAARIATIAKTLGLDEPPAPAPTDPMAALHDHLERMRLERESSASREPDA